MDEAGEAKEEEQERRRCSALMGRGVGTEAPVLAFHSSCRANEILRLILITGC